MRLDKAGKNYRMREKRKKILVTFYEVAKCVMKSCVYRYYHSSFKFTDISREPVYDGRRHRV